MIRWGCMTEKLVRNIQHKHGSSNLYVLIHVIEATLNSNPSTSKAPTYKACGRRRGSLRAYTLNNMGGSS